MARPSAMAALLLLLVISLLAVTHCRTVAVAADHAAIAVSDENGQSSNPTLAAEVGASAIIDEEVLPPEQQHGFEFLRLPSHHRPCSLHRHTLWKPHPRVYYRDPAFRFDDYDYCSGHDDGERREAVSHLDILPRAEVRETEEVKPVAEPDPDRSLPDSDGDGELVASRDPSSFADTDGHDGAPPPRKKEMLQRWLRYAYFHFHHHDEEDEEKNILRKLRLRQAEHGEDSDDEDEEVEEMVWRFRKVFMRMWRRFGHDAKHGHRHRHAVEAEKQADGEQSSVIAWIEGLMNTVLNF